MKFGKGRITCFLQASNFELETAVMVIRCYSVFGRNFIQEYGDTVPCSVKDNRNTVKSIAARNRNGYSNLSFNIFIT